MELGDAKTCYRDFLFDGPTLSIIVRFSDGVN